MASSRWPAVVDALLTALSAAPALAGKVFDGLPVTADAITDGVFLGVLLDDAPSAESGTFAQEWHEMGGIPPRDETGIVRCSVLTQRGDSDLAEVRAAAFDLLAAVESVVRSDYDLGVTDLLWLHVQAGQVRQGQTPRGVYCEVLFSIAYSALI